MTPEHAPSAIDAPRADAFARRLRRGRLTRRDSLWLFGAAAAAPSLSGCATSPVTGERILAGLTPDDEREIDRRQSPHQFSQDLGPIQDAPVNAYVADVGARLDAQAHRRDVPYSYRVLNANYVNAYTFPAGSVGVTRGILAELDSEAELAALLGHELAHVNARHTAQQQGQALLAQAAVMGLTIGAAATDSDWTPLIGLGGQIGASALLARYSRTHEREADALGQEYMVRAGYPADGMVGLHRKLLDENARQPGLLETMFSSHPMSAERLQTAQRLAETRYAASRTASAQRERFMDRTASVRALKPTIEACQRGETAMAKKDWNSAQDQFGAALRRTPGDYAANLRMAQCLQAQRKLTEARRYADAAHRIYPTEGQAMKLSATLKLAQREPAGALEDLQGYERVLPGDPGITFLKGVSLEAMGQQRPAADQYAAYLRATQQGQAAQYAASRLRTWGYLR